MKNILFVDDEINILNGLKRMLNTKKHEWSMSFVQSGKEALEMLRTHTFDIIVSDMRMPCMNGVQLLTTIRVEYPRITRIALSGYSDTEMILDSIKATHLFISKPTDFTTLSSAIERCLSIQSMINDNDLCDFMSSLNSLPCVPEIYNQLVHELTTQGASIDSIGKIIEQDIAMSAKLLQIVNSAYFGLAREICSPAEAAAHLGLDIIKSLVLSIKIFEAFEDESRIKKVNSIFRRSQAAAQLAIAIAKEEGLTTQEHNQLFIAGLLQDVGELVICNYFSQELQDEYDAHTDINLTSQIDIERKIYGVSHEQISVYLLHLWGIPLPVVECVAYHKGGINPINFEELSLSDILFLANLIITQSNGKALPDNITNEESFQKYSKQWQSVII